MKKFLIFFVLLLSTLSYGTVRNVTAAPCNAVGNGVHDDTPNINICIGLLVSGDTLEFPAGTYLVTKLNIINVSNITIDGSNNTATVRSVTTQQGPFFSVGIQGIESSTPACSGNWPGIAPGSALSSTANETSTTFSTTSSLSGIGVGGYVLLLQGGKDSSSGGGDTSCDLSGCRGEFVKITNVSSTIYTVDTMLHDTFNPSVNAAIACPIQGVINNVTLQNITFDGGSTTAQTSGNTWGVQFNTCANCTISGVTFKNTLGSAFLHTLNYNLTVSNVTITGAGSDGCGAAWQGYANSNEVVNTVSLSSLNPGTSVGVCLGDGAFGLEDVNFDNSIATNVTINSSGAGGRPMKLTASRWSTYNNLVVENGNNAAGFNGLSLEYYTSHDLFSGGSIINNAGGGGSGSGGINTFGNFNQFDVFANLTITENGNVQVINSKFDALGLAQDTNQSWFGNTIGGSGTTGFLYYGSNGCIKSNTLNSGLGSGISINSPSTGTVCPGNTLNGNSNNCTNSACSTSGANGAGPVATPSPTSIAFGNQTVGTTSASQTITLTNGIGSFNGTNSLSVSTLRFQTGTQFAASGCGSLVAAGGTCAINVTFSPTTAGAKSDVLEVLDNGTGAWLLIPLTGTGTSSGAITPSPLSVSFANQQVGTTSAASNVTFTNTYSSTATITSLTTTGDFTQSNSCGGTIAASGGTCVVYVTFTPTTTGLRSGSLVMVPSLGGTITVPLSGTGTPAPTVPTVTTTTASSISTTGAIAGGTVTSNGGASITSEGTCYATTANPTSPCTSDGTATPFTSTITGLTSSTTYHYRAFATNSVGTGYGSDMTFTTQSTAVPPTVTTTVATSITTHSAVSGGVVTSNGGASVTSEGVCYSTTPNPISPCTSDGIATPYTSNLSGLTVHVTYNYRAFATNSAGTSYGANLTFFTTGGGGGNTQGGGIGSGSFVITFGNPGCLSLATIPPPTVAPFSGLTGAGTIVSNPEPANYTAYGCFGLNNPIVRVSDANSSTSLCTLVGGSCPSQANQSEFADNSDGEDNNWSVDDLQFTTVNSGNNYHIWNFNPTTMVPTPCYTDTIGAAWHVNPTYSRVTSKLVYSWNGQVLSSYLLNGGSCPLSTPTPMSVFDFSTTTIANTYTFKTDGVSMNNNDTVFADGFSTSGTQNTAVYACAYKVGSGWSCLNTNTGVVTGSFGTTGPASCLNCGISPPNVWGSFNIHNVKMSLDGSYLIIGQGGSCLSGTCYTGPMMWQIGTTNEYGCNTNCSGHGVGGNTVYANQYNRPFWQSTPYNGVGGVSFPPTYCSTSPGQTFDQHPSWWNNKGFDQEAFFFSTTAVASNPTYNMCTKAEIDALFAPTNALLSGQLRRYAHNYTAATNQFAVQNGIAVVSQTGRFVMFTSPMANSSTYIGQLGDTTGTYPCTTQGLCRGDVFIVRITQ